MIQSFLIYRHMGVYVKVQFYLKIPKTDKGKCVSTSIVSVF